MAGDSANVTASTPATASGRPRPQLKGLHLAYMKKHLYLAIAFSVSGMIAAKFLINEPRKRAYAEYHRTYDIEAAYERMRKLGLFTHAGPED